MSTVTWLHFSDLHLCEKQTRWDAGRILRELEKDIAGLREREGLVPDLIFFTGDAAFGQIRDEEGLRIQDQFKEAQQFFEDIRSAVSKDLPVQNVFLVPGNHDVNRAAVGLVQAGFESEIPEDEGEARRHVNELMHKGGLEWQDMVRRLNDYREFLSSASYGHLLEDRERLVYASIRDIHGVKVGVAGLNSVWSSHGDNECGTLWLAGHWQVENAHSKLKDAEFKIALAHHPCNWLKAAESADAAREISREFAFFLHGHEHDDWVDQGEDGHTRIEAGASYGESSEETGYNIVQLDVGTGKGKVWLRRFDSTGGGWVTRPVADRAPDGIWPIDAWAQRLSRAGAAPGGTTPSPRTEEPEPQDAERGPDEAPEPGTPESRGVFGRGGEIARLAKEVAKRSVVVVFGLSGIGKTVLIQEAAKSAKHRHREYHPTRITPDTDAAGLYSQLAATLGCHDENPALTGLRMGKLDFGFIKRFAKQSKPALIHLWQAQNLFTRDGFRDAATEDLLVAIATHFPEDRIVLECREECPNGVLADMGGKSMKVTGMDQKGMCAYFRRPFSEEPEKGWNLGERDAEVVYGRLGGRSRHRAHPLAMTLLAGVADGAGESPAQVLARPEHVEKLERDLEVSLFRDLYDRILNASGQHLLRLCALYQGGIPDLHVGALSSVVGDEDAFGHLRRRCLLTPSPAEDWYFLHAIITELTERRIDKESDEFFDDHELIADAWLSQLKMSDHPSQPNIRAANAAFYHLTEAQCYRRLHELSERLLSRDVLPHLDHLREQLHHAGKRQEQRDVLELIVRLDPTDHKSRRFLGETIERFEGEGHAHALAHYEEAHRLRPDFPPYLANLGKCLLTRGEPQAFVDHVGKLDQTLYDRVMDDHCVAIYANCLDQLNRADAASKLRRARIDAGSRNAAFYCDEALYLHGLGRSTDALEVLALAEKRGCTDDYTPNVRARIMAEME